MTRPIEIIAEIGVNHNGSLDRARKMIRMAKTCGADVAKFQVYDPVKVLDPEHPDIKPWWDLILQTQFDQSEWRTLAAYCNEIGIEFFCSVFDPADVEWLNPLVKRWKIASRSMYDVELAAAIAETGKLVIVSWGYYDGRDPVIWDMYQHGQVLNLYCISKYPASLTDHRFLSSGYRRSIFREGRVFAGFSDHSEGTLAATVAMAMGAGIIEKHFTLDHTMPGPDHRCSANAIELSTLCSIRDEIENMLYRAKEGIYATHEV